MSERPNCPVPVLLATILFIVSSAAGADHWPRFRGENGSGISDVKGIPTTWSPGDFAWNIEVPGVGHAAPIIWGDTLFITSAREEGLLRDLHCLDAATGESRWKRTSSFSRSHKHLKNSWASSTPTTDGERVYAAFADDEDFIVTAYDFNGDLVWRRNFGPFDSRHGLGASPVLFEDLLIVPNDQQGPSSLSAVDRHTGETVWSTLRSSGHTSYASPLIVHGNGGAPPQLIASSFAMGVTSLDPRTGRVNWMTGELPARTVGSPLLADELIVQCCGGGGVGKLLLAVETREEAGSNPASRIRYERAKRLPYVPTPVAYRDHLYLWNDNGVVSCVETQTGRNVWTERVGETYSGSPICVDGAIYAISEKGNVVVIAASPKFKLFGKTPLGDPSHSTPAAAHGRLYLRTYHRLACLEAIQ